MRALLLRIAFRFVLCALPTWGVWRFLQWAGQPPAIALALCAPLFGVALARPVMDTVAWLHRTSRELALADVQGRYYNHHGKIIDVVEDAEDQRWLLASDARKVVTGLPRDEVLLRQYPDRAGAVADAIGFRVRADALLEYLGKSRDPASLRFKVWLEREVVCPSRKR